ncbi:MAG TPA: hypothetical protein VGM34_01620 [Chlamydiales bacterium]
MTAKAISVFSHQSTFDQILERLGRIPELCHMIISYGGVEEQEINTEIQELLSKTHWNLPLLKKESYWNCFSRHITEIRFPAVYFTDEQYLPFLERIREVTSSILASKGSLQPSGTSIASSLTAPVLAANSAIVSQNNATQKLRCVQFGLGRDEEPKKFGFFTEEFVYQDQSVIQAFRSFLPNDLEEIRVMHPITVIFFRRLILSYRELRTLEIAGSGIHSAFSKVDGFIQNTIFSRKALHAYMSGLPRSISCLHFPELSSLYRNDENIAFLANRFPLIEKIWCYGQCAETLLTSIGKLKNLKHLTFDTGEHFTKTGLLHLKHCTQLRTVKFFKACPPLDELVPCLPATLTKFTVLEFTSFKASDISFLGAFPKLTALKLKGVSSDGHMMQRLAQSNPLLEEIDMEECQIDPKEISHIRSAFPNLKSLILGDGSKGFPNNGLGAELEAFRNKRPKVKVHVAYLVETSNYDYYIGSSWS